ARELQLGGSLLGHVAYDVERIGLGLRVIVLVQDFEAIIDRADGADHVVANLAGNKGRKLQIGWRGVQCHECPQSRTSIESGRRFNLSNSSLARNTTRGGPISLHVLIHASRCDAKPTAESSDHSVDLVAQ